MDTVAAAACACIAITSIGKRCAAAADARRFTATATATATALPACLFPRTIPATVMIPRLLGVGPKAPEPVPGAGESE